MTEETVQEKACPEVKPTLNSKLKQHRFFLISYGALGTTIFLLGLIAMIINGAFPCLHTLCHPNATCFNKPFEADCKCNYGYSGNGRDHCDECGVTYFDHNAHKYSAVSVPYSWPASGITELLYTAFDKIGYQRMLVQYYDQCGAVLINRRTALTAAHCIKQNFQAYDWNYDLYFTVNITFNNFHPNYESIYSMFFGTHNFIYYGMDLPHVQMGDIHDIYIHPDFDNTTYENDIAVIKFVNEIELNRYVQVACLPEKVSTEDSFLSKIYGYVAGFSSSGNSFTTWVQHNIRLDLYNNSMCENVQPEKEKNWNLQFCAGEYNLHGNSTGQCHGDYGSALYVHDTVGDKKKYVAVGLLSYDVTCTTEHSP
ncbi:Transmembrane protease serine, partial [Brachionus plicatilis]